MSPEPITLRRSFGRYEILRTLGQGGMGEVYLARMSGAAGFEKLCVIKTVLPHLAREGDFLDRFLHEAKTLVRLNHSSIAAIYDMGEVDGTLFLALEYVSGVAMSMLMDRARAQGQRIPIDLALHIGQRMAEALAYVHRRTDETGAPLGLVHRDVSPQNVMLSYDGEVKVIDFGLARSTARVRHTLPSTMLGKLGYMSPEQAQTQAVDARTDIYSCGLVVWELLAGTTYFGGSTVPEMLIAMARPPRRPLTAIRPDVSPALDAAVQRAIEPDLAKRYATADEMTHAFGEQLVRTGSVVGGERLGAFVRQLCPDEFALERKLESDLAKLTRASAPNSLKTQVDSRAGVAAGMATSPGSPPFEPPATLLRTGSHTPRNRTGAIIGVAAGLAVAAAGVWLWQSRPSGGPNTTKETSPGAAPIQAAAVSPVPEPTVKPATPEVPPAPSPPAGSKEVASAPPKPEPHPAASETHHPNAKDERSHRRAPKVAEAKSTTRTTASATPPQPEPSQTGESAQESTSGPALTGESAFLRLAGNHRRVILYNGTDGPWNGCTLELSDHRAHAVATIASHQWIAVPLAAFTGGTKHRARPPGSLKVTCTEGSGTFDYPAAEPTPPPLVSPPAQSGTLEGHAEVGTSGEPGDTRFLVYNDGAVKWNNCKVELSNGRHIEALKSFYPHRTAIFRSIWFTGEASEESNPASSISLTCVEGKSVLPLR